MDLLTELTEHCVQLLDVASAGLLLVDTRRQLHLMAATRDMELFQLQWSVPGLVTAPGIPSP